MWPFKPKKGTLHWHWKYNRGQKLMNTHMTMYYSDKKLDKEHDWYLYLNYFYKKPKLSPCHRNKETGLWFIGFTDEDKIDLFTDEVGKAIYEGFIISNDFGNGHVCYLTKHFVEDTNWIVYKD